MNKYVYVILDITIPCNIKCGEHEFSATPIYIGKGNYNRWNSHFIKARRGDTRTCIRAKIKQLIDSKNTPIVKVLYENLTKDESSRLEIELIRVIGRKISNDGPLYNITIGGEGGDTYNNNPNKENIIKKLRNRPTVWNKGKTKDTDIRVKKLSDTLRSKLKLGEIIMPSRRGILWDMKMKKRLSESHQGIKLATPRKDANRYKFTNVFGETIILVGTKRVDEFLLSMYPELTRYKLLHNNRSNFKLEII
jgi:hypothetical protein